jgi:CheY-like chemotaxis protein
MEQRGFPPKVVTGAVTILLVDDDEIVIDVAKRMLEKIGCKVLLAESGEDAVALYGKKKDEIDLIVLDMMMPDMGGGEAYDRLKAINPEVMVLLSSGYSVDGQAAKILKRGCNGFIQKPFSIGELSQRIGEILGRE